MNRTYHWSTRSGCPNGTNTPPRGQFFKKSKSLWPFDLKIYRAHPWLMGRLHVKFHDDRCKGKAVMRREPFFSNLCIVTLTFDLLTSKSIGHILASWEVCMWSFMIIGVKGKQLCAGNHFQEFTGMHCDLDLWPFDLKIYRAHPWLIGSLHVKFNDDRCKGKAVMRRKPFSVIYALWPWPLTFWPQNL